MLPEFQKIATEIDVLCSPDYLESERQRICLELKRASLIYEFYDLKSQQTHGQIQHLKQQIADKYHVDVKTVEKYVYPLKIENS